MIPASAFERRLARQYPLELKPEAPAEAVERHQRVAKRRAGPVVMVLRGATDVLPENSLEAYHAAMDFGADGCLVDIRRTKDGIYVLFQDEMLDRLTEGYGRVRDLTYVELSSLPARFVHGKPVGIPPPTFVALLEMARDRSMLLHLVLHEPGMDLEVAEWLEGTDLWDHVVFVESAYSAAIRNHPSYRPLNYKDPNLGEGRRDLDPATVRQALGAPGQMILVADPRVAVLELERKRLSPGTLHRAFQMVAVGTVPGEENVRQDGAAMHWLWLLANGIRSGEEKILMRLATGPVVGTNQHYGRLSAREAHVLQIAWACRKLGELGTPNASRRKVLKEVLERSPKLDVDPAYAGVERAAAVRAICMGKDVALVSDLVVALEKEPRVQEVSEGTADLTALMASYRFRREVLIALGDLPCRSSRKFLRQYLEGNSKAMDPKMPLFEEAIGSLLRQPLTWDQLAGWLRSENAVIRGAALFLCVDHPTEERRKALRAGAPWALSLSGSRF
jgi:hypothetical protein